MTDENEEKTLTDLYSAHDGKLAHKWASYLKNYEEIFKPYRGKPIDLLEIGVQNGGSLEIWSEYFAQARNIIGCDINENCRNLSFSHAAVTVVVGDANVSSVVEKITAITSGFDIVIDDGSHISSDIIKSFLLYFPAVREGGIYVAEDLCCSYWPAWEGGLFEPKSSYAFFKLLVDVINFEHWPHRTFREDYLRSITGDAINGLETVLAEIHSVEFRNSLCIIRKKASAENIIGPTWVSGREQPVTQNNTIHGSKITTPSPIVGAAALLRMQQQVQCELAERIANIVTHPWFESRYRASPDLPGDFDPRLYLVLNPDVHSAGVDPFFHYLRHGRLEGRRYK